jgi:hypothetical protein
MFDPHTHLYAAVADRAGAHELATIGACDLLIDRLTAPEDDSAEQLDSSVVVRLNRCSLALCHVCTHTSLEA